jgi:hypothetical protein
MGYVQRTTSRTTRGVKLDGFFGVDLFFPVKRTCFYRSDDFFTWRILRCASVSPALFLRRPAQRAAEQRPDEERVGSDPRLGFAAFFYPPRSSLCGLFGAKKLGLATRKQAW